MRMAPIYSPDGRLLGHLNMKDCVQTRHSVVVENSPHSPRALPPPSSAKFMSETTEIFHVPLRKLRFRCESSERTVLCLVADKLPDWFWDAYPTVQFSSDNWKRP